SDLPLEEGAGPNLRGQLLEALNVRAWHEAGYRGLGLKVAVLDSGFCGFRAHLGKALPAQVKTRSFRLDGNLEAKESQHGLLCAAVIHTLAAEATCCWPTGKPSDRNSTWKRSAGPKAR